MRAGGGCDTGGTLVLMILILAAFEFCTPPHLWDRDPREINANVTAPGRQGRRKDVGRYYNAAFIQFPLRLLFLPTNWV